MREGAYDSFGRTDRRSRRAIALEKVVAAFAGKVTEGMSFLAYGNGPPMATAAITMPGFWCRWRNVTRS